MSSVYERTRSVAKLVEIVARTTPDYELRRSVILARRERSKVDKTRRESSTGVVNSHPLLGNGFS